MAETKASRLAMAFFSCLTILLYSFVYTACVPSFSRIHNHRVVGHANEAGFGTTTNLVFFDEVLLHFCKLGNLRSKVLILPLENPLDSNRHEEIQSVQVGVGG